MNITSACRNIHLNPFLLIIIKARMLIPYSIPSKAFWEGIYRVLTLLGVSPLLIGFM